MLRDFIIMKSPVSLLETEPSYSDNQLYNNNVQDHLKLLNSPLS